jgi:MoaA/NifB/PqqE/SkfB family radical SAM enzyme
VKGRKDTLCALPFMHLNVMPNGTVHPCCSSPQPVLDDKGEPLNIRAQSLPEVWNSRGMRVIRAAMLRGEEPHHCVGCYKAERAGGASVRTNYNGMILRPGNGRDEFTGFSRVDPAEFKEVMALPTYFDLRFDNVCNLKCVICYASESSSIELDPVHTAWTGEG